MLEEWADRFIQWFEEEKADSDKPLDEHWDVHRESQKDGEGNDIIWIIAENPRVPYKILVQVWKGFATFIVHTSLETEPTITFLKDSDMTGEQKKLKIYRDLLLLNDDWRMVKFVIAGDNKEIRLKTELNLHSLNREEFSDALSATLFAMTDLFTTFGLEDRLEEAQQMHILDIIQTKASEGNTKEQIVAYIARTFKVGTDVAMDVVNAVLKKESAPREEPDSPMYR